jgi:hypothetical protein
MFILDWQGFVLRFSVGKLRSKDNEHDVIESESGDQSRFKRLAIGTQD